MPKQPQPAPRLRGMLATINRIENPFLRRLTGFVLLFAVSLAIGFVCEKAFDRETLARAQASQKLWIDRLAAMAPLALVKGYWADLGPAMRGEWIYRPPPLHSGLTLTPEELAAVNEARVKAMACELARVLPSQSPECEAAFRSGLSASVCIAEPGREGCALYSSCLDQSAQALGRVPPGCALAPPRPPLFAPPDSRVTDSPATTAPSEAERKTWPMHPLLAPAAALVRTLTRLSHGGIWHAALPIGQLLMGAAGFWLFARWNNARREDLTPVFIVLVVPIGVVATSSLMALGMKWMMLGALHAFHGVTGLAAAAAGASGITGFCWMCLSKLTEKGVEAAVTGKA